MCISVTYMSINVTYMHAMKSSFITRVTYMYIMKSINVTYMYAM